MNKKKVIITTAVIVAALGIGGTAWYFLKDGGSSSASGENMVFVDSVSNVTGAGLNNGLLNRYSGVVEPQETLKVEVPQDKKVKELFVEAGQQVKKGDKLFVYDTQETEDALITAQIELDRIAADIDANKENITDLQKEKKQASADEQLSYTTRIQTLQNTQKRNEYDMKRKKIEMENLKKATENSEVYSEIDGIVKTINKDGSLTNNNGTAEAYMTILTNGDFRIKAKVNEQNASSIIEGEQVIVHSRVDAEKTWKGTLSAVDRDKPETSQNNMYMSSGSSSDTSSSNYPFYVNLENMDGLMLGQHVYIEMDYGQTEVKEGLWLDSYYIVMENEDTETAYVWSSTEKEKLEKRELTLGEFDEELQKYQILDGLTIEDYIAFPNETYTEGMSTTQNLETMDQGGMNGSLDGGIDSGMEGNMEGGMLPEVSGGVEAIPEESGGGTIIGGSDEAVPMEMEGGDESVIEMPSVGKEIGDGSAPAEAGMEAE